MSVAGKNVLVIGGTRFSGLYLVHALHEAGVGQVSILNRGNKQPDDPSLMVPGESAQAFSRRVSKTNQITADRTDSAALISALSGNEFDVIYDNNGRELSDSQNLIDYATDTGAHYVYMSSAGVYEKSYVLPHVEGDAVDVNCRHKGKLHTEEYLKTKGTALKWTSVRPTYIYGALNYNPLEQWFFERIVSGRPVCVPGHGMHLTGLGHVRDLASAMTLMGANPVATGGSIYNVQDNRAISFDGVAKLCAGIAGVGDLEIVHYEPKDYDFGKKKAFPFRPQHFFTSAAKAARELDWNVQFDLEKGFRDTYENDFLVKQRSNRLKNDFVTDDMILQRIKGAAAAR